MSRLAFWAFSQDFGFRPSGVVYADPGAWLAAIPDGATTCVARCTGPGGSAAGAGAGGGAWSETTIDLAGMTALYVFVGDADDDTYVRADSDSGTVLCLAKGGRFDGPGLASSGVGDRKQSGGAGATAGGGAAGIETIGGTFPWGLGALPATETPKDGGPASGAVPGNGPGWVAGDGGQLYGGGGAAPNNLGRSGHIQLFWR